MSAIRYKGRLYKASKFSIPSARVVEIIEKGILKLNTEYGEGKHNITPTEAKERARNIAQILLLEIETHTS